MRAVAAAAAAVKQSAGIVLGHDLTVRVPHAVDVLLNRTQTQHLTAARLTQYELLLFAAHVTLERCNTLNPATLLPLPQAGQEQEHDCLIKTDEQVKGRIDLRDQPLEGAEGTLFCDGSCYKLKDGTTVAGYAVSTEDSIVETGKVPELSAQAAELHALIAALKLSAGKVVNIFTDSAYAHGVAFGFGKLWRERGFMTAQGGKVRHFSLVNDVLNALTLPEKVALVKCPAHKKITDYIGEGNALADRGARWAAEHGEMKCVNQGGVQMLVQGELTVEDGVVEIQKTASVEEQMKWAQDKEIISTKGGALVSKATGQWVLPDAYLPTIVKGTHGLTHVNAGAMKTMIEGAWLNKNIDAACRNWAAQCAVCLAHNKGKGVTTPAGHSLLPSAPLETVYMDFIQLPPVGKFQYCLVLKCGYSGWTDAYPLRDNTAKSVAKCILKHWVPLYTVPRRLFSDNGPHFTGEVVKYVCTALGIDQRFHTVYHPKSTGLVENVNSDLKTKLAKACETMGLKWPDALPLALLSIRTTPKGNHKLSPYEIVMGRPPSVWTVPKFRNICDFVEPALVDYCTELTNKLRSINQQVRDAAPEPLKGVGHNLQPGDQIYIKVFDRKNGLQPRWRGPHQVLLTTPTAVKVENRTNWIHATHTKRAPIVKEVDFADRPHLLHGTTDKSDPPPYELRERKSAVCYKE